MKRPRYRHAACHRCSAAGCDRCADSGFVLGPKCEPVPLNALTAAERNLRDIRRKDA